VSAAPRSRAWDPTLDPPLEWLERANRHALVTRLVASTVHDVSNALQVMSGAAEMLGLDASPDAVARRSASIVHQATGATAVLQQLAGFSREPVRPAERVRVRDLCERVLALRQYALRKGRVSAQVTGDEAVAQGPARPLFQVLLNLIVNAEQALVDCPDPVLTLSVSAADGGVALDVRDNGRGLGEGPADRLLLWPPPLVTEPGTLGIGLLVSRGLVERAGGSLSIAAAPDGRGSVVRVRLVAGAGP
jgi:C4-dicarboxylate-specific signal transduction histidine kinase